MPRHVYIALRRMRTGEAAPLSSLGCLVIRAATPLQTFRILTRYLVRGGGGADPSAAAGGQTVTASRLR